MSLRIDTSVQLVWALANTEANLAGDKLLCPVHFFLGVLKLLDPGFLSQLKNVELTDEEQTRILEMGKQARHFLEMSVDDVTRLRRSLRAKLRTGETCKKEIHMLHRTEESRAVFIAAGKKTIQDGRDGLTLLDLLEALFETGAVSLDGLKKIPQRPSSKGARWEVADDTTHKHTQGPPDWFGRNLSHLAAKGSLHPFIGREREIKILMRVLTRTNKRHTLIISEPGVGKTALVEGLAQALITNKTLSALNKVQILEIHGSDIASDCPDEAKLSQRLTKILQIVDQINGAVLFIDDFYGLFPAHLRSDAALAILTTALSEDTPPCIFTTTKGHYSQLTKISPTLLRRFHLLELHEPSKEDCSSIAAVWVKRITNIQNISFTREAIEAIMAAAESAPLQRGIPDRIVDLLENAATFAKVAGMSSKTKHDEVTRADVQSLLADQPHNYHKNTRTDPGADSTNT